MTFLRDRIVRVGRVSAGHRNRPDGATAGSVAVGRVAVGRVAVGRVAVGRVAVGRVTAGTGSRQGPGHGRTSSWNSKA
ncbi:hypothetical protein ACFYRC_18625 [Streptomyces sp. NPDC005279]|uniref:hypothetical protein n=1 Tax=Streptomyces sp. NPDC005279 TaxID=3364712 RepID=UPI0036B21C3B